MRRAWRAPALLYTSVCLDLFEVEGSRAGWQERHLALRHTCVRTQMHTPPHTSSPSITRSPATQRRSHTGALG